MTVKINITKLLCLFVLLLCGCKSEEIEVAEDELIDIDKNIYKTIVIGDQIWMSENLKTTRLNDGTNIQPIEDNDTWDGLSEPGICWYNNEKDLYEETYGALYNWHAVNTEKLCPNGWHVPTQDEWFILIDFLGEMEIAGSKMKMDTSLWQDSSTITEADIQFNALPAGFRLIYGGFDDLGESANWWTSNSSSPEFALLISVFDIRRNVYNLGYRKTYGLSVRCLKD